jgi:hypothetical protein
MLHLLPLLGGSGIEPRTIATLALALVSQTLKPLGLISSTSRLGLYTFNRLTARSRFDSDPDKTFYILMPNPDPSSTLKTRPRYRKMIGKFYMYITDFSKTFNIKHSQAFLMVNGYVPYDIDNEFNHHFLEVYQ